MTSPTAMRSHIGAYIRTQLAARFDGTGETQSLEKKAEDNPKETSSRIPRKKLPWLGGYQKKADMVPDPQSDAREAAREDVKVDAATPESPDAALKDGTNAPKSRTQTPNSRSRSATPSSRARSVVRPAYARGTPAAPVAYASSEYSTSPSDGEPLPATLPKKDPASYERLVEPPSDPVPKRRSNRVVHDSHRSEPDISPGQAVAVQGVESPARRGTTRPKPKPGTRRRHSGPSSSTQARRCRSCDSELEQAVIPTARDLYLNHQVQPPREQRNVPRAPPSRSSGQQTLHEIPLHLMAHSSSSSQSNVERQLDTLKRAVTESFGASQPQKRLARAVTAHADLMKEAAFVVKAATAQGRHEEVSDLLKSANLAMNQTGNMQGATTRNPPLSPPMSLGSSESDQDPVSDPALPHGQRLSSQPMSAAFTKSSKPKIQTTATGSRFKERLTDEVGNRGDREARAFSSGDYSITQTPPHLYQPRSADSIVKDFAYGGPAATRKLSAQIADRRAQYGAAADFYNDHGESVATQPGVRKSIVTIEKKLPATPLPGRKHSDIAPGKTERVHRAHHMRHIHQTRGLPDADEGNSKQGQKLIRPPTSRQATVESMHGPSEAVPAILRDKLDLPNEPGTSSPSSGAETHGRLGHHGHMPAFMQSAYYRDDDESATKKSVTAATVDSRYENRSYSRRSFLMKCAVLIQHSLYRIIGA